MRETNFVIIYNAGPQQWLHGSKSTGSWRHQKTQTTKDKEKERRRQQKTKTTKNKDNKNQRHQNTKATNSDKNSNIIVLGTWCQTTHHNYIVFQKGPNSQISVYKVAFAFAS